MTGWLGRMFGAKKQPPRGNKWMVCPHCSASYEFVGNLEGLQLPCPACGKEYVVRTGADSPKGTPAHGIDRDIVYPTPSLPREWEAGTVLCRQWRIERQLGAGGMGAVYLARSVTSGHTLAVKRVHLDLMTDPGARRAFLQELEAWMALSDQDNIAQCRFYRTIDDEIVTFADVAEGGSLADWIERRAFSDSLQILDVAIQFAWGLDAAHRAGLVHQDVKPANVLMTREGIPMVSDFGLAAFSAASEPDSPAFVRLRGMTPAYCSPEQAQNALLTAATDQWSWALSILQMFAGQIFWRSGVEASSRLELYTRQPGIVSGGMAIPRPVADVLRRCLAEDPAQRWPSMSEAASALGQCYEAIAGRPNPRTRRVPAARPVDPRFNLGSWSDPRAWVERALMAAGRGLEDVDELAPPLRGAGKAGIVATLLAYEEAVRIYEPLVVHAQAGEAIDFGHLLREKAIVHIAAGDLDGASACLDRSARVWQSLITAGNASLTFPLLGVLLNRGVIASMRAENRLALDLFQQITERARILVELGMLQEAIDININALTNQSQILMAMKRLEESLAAIDKAERLLTADGKILFRNAQCWTACLVNKTSVLRQLGRFPEAIETGAKAVDLISGLIEECGMKSLGRELASAYVNYGLALECAHRNEDALAAFDKAHSIFRSLIEIGHSELDGELAKAASNRARVLAALGQQSQAGHGYQEARELLHGFVHHEGHDEALERLERALEDELQAVQGSDAQQAIGDLYQRLIEVRESLVRQQDTDESRIKLATALLDAPAASVSERLGRVDRAIVHAEYVYWRRPDAGSAIYLAYCYTSKSLVVQESDLQLAFELLDQAIDLLRGHDDGSVFLCSELGRTLTERATLLASYQGDLSAARAELDDAVASYLRAIDRDESARSVDGLVRTLAEIVIQHALLAGSSTPILADLVLSVQSKCRNREWTPLLLLKLRNDLAWLMSIDSHHAALTLCVEGMQCSLSDPDEHVRFRIRKAEIHGMLGERGSSRAEALKSAPLLAQLRGQPDYDELCALVHRLGG